MTSPIGPRRKNLSHLRSVPKQTYHVSQVCFAEMDPVFNVLVWYEPSGNERMVLLQSVLDGEELPEGILLAVALNGKLIGIAPGQIDWGTCGLKPGGKGRFIW